jgi:dTDP-4-amino-4,6-dideoxygalactose transaminase
MTTAEGGMLISKHSQWLKKIGKLRAFGMDKHVGERTVPGFYDILDLGFNYRLNEMQAALGIEQLKRLPGFFEKRAANYWALVRELESIDEVELFQSSHGEYHSSYYCLSAVLKNSLAGKRLQFMEELRAQGVGPSIYYPQPVPHMTYYKNKYGYADNSFPVASWISQNSIALPVGPHVNAEDVQYIGRVFKSIVVRLK